jgi:hypothetical protein
MDAVQLLPHPHQLSTVRTRAEPRYTSPSRQSGFPENDRKTKSLPPGQGQSLPSIHEALNHNYLPLLGRSTSRQPQQAQQSPILHVLANQSTRGGSRGLANLSPNETVGQSESGPAISRQSPLLPETFQSRIQPVSGRSSTNVSLLSLNLSKSFETASPIIGSETRSGRDKGALIVAGGKAFANGPASFPQVVQPQWRIPTSTPTTTFFHHGVRPCDGTLWKSGASKPVHVQELEGQLRCAFESTQLQDESSKCHSDVYKVHASLNEVCLF